MAEAVQVQPITMTELEISKICSDIGNEHVQLHFNLHLTDVQQHDLSLLYRHNVREKIRNMIQKWHDVVVSEGENPRQLLAAALVVVGNRALAEKFYTGIIDEKWQPKDSTKQKLKQMTFDLKDKPNFVIKYKHHTVTATDDAHVVFDGKLTAHKTDMIQLVKAIPQGYSAELDIFDGGIVASQKSNVCFNKGAEIETGLVKQVENLILCENQQPVDVIGDSVDGNPTSEQEKMNQIRRERAKNVPIAPASGFELKQKDKPELKRKFNKADNIKVLIDWVGSQEGSTTHFSISFPGSKVKINSWDYKGSLEENKITANHSFEVRWEEPVLETENQYVTSLTE